MKVDIQVGEKYATLRITPETGDDETILLKLAERRTSMISCRGFQYMIPEVEFLIQNMPSSD